MWNATFADKVCYVSSRQGTLRNLLLHCTLNNRNCYSGLLKGLLLSQTLSIRGSRKTNKDKDDKPGILKAFI